MIHPAAALAVLVPVLGGTALARACPGDCNRDGTVRVSELVVAVRIALGEAELSSCAGADADGDGAVSVAELVSAVGAALAGCPAPTATPTSSPTPELPAWEERASLRAPRQEVGVAALDGWIYAAGGFDGSGRAVATVERYDPVTDTWEEVAPLPLPLHHANVAAAGGRLWVAGGLGPVGFRPSGRVLLYDPERDTWEDRAPLPRPRGASGTAVLDDRIYVFGGLAEASVADCSVYDPATDTWSTLPSMPTPRDHLGAAAARGRLYAVGGRRQGIFAVLDTVEVYDPAAQRWATAAAMPTGRGGLAVAALGGLVYAIGGEGNANRPDGVFAAVERYDPTTDTWAILPPLPVPRHGMGAAGVGNAIFVPGGAVRAGFGATDLHHALRVR